MLKKYIQHKWNLDRDHSLKRLKTSVVQMGTTVHTYTVARVLHRSKLFGDGDEEKPLLEKAQMKSGLDINQRCVGDSKVSWKKVPLSNQKKKQLSNSVCKKMKSKTPQKW